MQAQQLAEQILSGFQNHYQAFVKITKLAPFAFAKQNWGEIERISKARISQYDSKVDETAHKLMQLYRSTQLNETLWYRVKQAYLERLTFHPQPELAETFYNSVFCRLFHRRYYNSDFIFIETQLANATSLPVEAEYRSYFPVVNGLKPTIKKMIEQIDFHCEFEDLDRDIRLLVKAFLKQAPNTHHQAHLMRFDILNAPFYRNKGAYIVGRVVSKSGVQPFIISILHAKNGKLLIDALLTNSSQMRVIFGFARAYFLVETHAPSALVKFLNQLMPNKTKAELYNAIGFHKQGKTEFYREFLQHLDNSEELFEVAAGTPGMVMMVFTLPSFPYVFKVIRDKFPESKPFTKDTVLQRYQLVKRHDRVGRMADTIEYSDVVIPVARFSPQLYQLLLTSISNSIRVEGENLVITHLYIERRITPLNLFVQQADDSTCEQVIKDYGNALKEMLAVNIFPGDMLLKNFGVSKHHRVIFYDYDEVQYLTEMNFRALPKQGIETMYDSGDISSAPQDVFPEQLCTFVLTNPKLREMFLNHHPDLAEVVFWQQAQRDIREKAVKHIYPYPQKNRFLQMAKKEK
ncbi:bifunctional isocitrate dehydrogenase kinase/phosphatase [Pseudoalteromonas peptidolytica]|uniref:Isocitrate dehydrogenase kinase/phosphatase n=1 Tax=Pseudoalteromonas peptidolytica F12-50-A1 TaxID=1315280 RepID=A0A8I0T491_9GAMM|nr:bifunctional isocitrate dehydrogenase kinase/phosphatase [Pseudoalteromonas peptidolytica]MBE0346755.1 isocitrate dehydrogenase kinase/phosphatase [Pseudoalteromonas peptidolytica F12-50-A1]NLR13665.1 bifunctional isocitrate dehydrogenase kinase/phosphatase [Pseudoalteromonas peptidolytica]